MSMRSRQMDTLQRIMSSFKHFEKKLDKLQEDVSFHGQTLTELRAIVTNLSTNTIHNPDIKTDDKRNVKKTITMQYDDHPSTEDPVKTKRKNSIQPLPNKIKTKSLSNPNYLGLGIVTSPNLPLQSKVPINTKDNTQTGKHSRRPRKAEAPRKATTLRVQKGTEKKRRNS